MVLRKPRSTPVPCPTGAVCSFHPVMCEYVLCTVRYAVAHGTMAVVHRLRRTQSRVAHRRKFDAAHAFALTTGHVLPIIVL